MHFPSLLIGCLSLMFLHSADAQAAGNMATSASGPGWTELGDAVVLQGKAGLRWANKDNGRDINWVSANAYCAKLGEGWRLPSVDELKGVFAAAKEANETTACGDAICSAPALLHLSSAWQWSKEPVTKDQSYDYEQLAWGLTLVNGRQTMALRFGAHASRALCVQSI